MASNVGTELTEAVGDGWRVMAAWEGLGLWPEGNRADNHDAVRLTENSLSWCPRALEQEGS